MTKEERIKEAWGEYYDEIEFYLTENGYLPYVYDVRMIRNENKIHFEHLLSSANLFRPKSLRGISGNNGWIKIESESDLPKADCSCEVMYQDGSWSIDTFYKSNNNFKSNHWRHITHYKPIIQSNSPLY